jgi:putative Mn2+ efflux pump MntP
MVWAGLRSSDEVVDQRPERHSFWNLAATGLATSIDAMAVGVGLAFVDVNIAWVALAIGCATFVMVTTGIMLGRVLGAAIGKRAEVVGGIVLVAVGAAIVYEHLHGAG